MKRWNGICDLLTDPDARRFMTGNCWECCHLRSFTHRAGAGKAPPIRNWIWLAAAAVGTVTLARTS